MKKYDLKQIHYFPIIANKSYVPNENIRLQVYGYVLNSVTFKIEKYTIYDKTTFINRWNAMSNNTLYRRGARAVSEIFFNSAFNTKRYFSTVANFNATNDTFVLENSTFNVPINTYLLLDVYDFYSPLEGTAMINGIRKSSNSNVSLNLMNVYGDNFQLSLSTNIAECGLPNIIYSFNSVPINTAHFINNYNNGVEI
jgi:hypothetical protein